jgi:hypothetical protein
MRKCAGEDRVNHRLGGVITNCKVQILNH